MMDEKKIFDLTLEEYRNMMARTKHKNRELNIFRAKSLREQGMSPSEIVKEMGVSESIIYLWLNRNK